jgi:hypothetical protein
MEMGSQHLAIVSGSRSKPCEEQDRHSLLRHWLGVFAVNAGQALDGDTLGIYLTLWTEAFADVSHDVLETAFRTTLATSKFWPIKVADVREHIDKAEDSRIEDEWQNVLEYALRYVYPDIGVRAPRPLPPDIDHAVRAAGGLHYLESCPTDELQWAKKRFIEDLTRQRKSGNIAAYLPESPLGKMLRAHAPRFALPAAHQTPVFADAGSVEEIADRIRNAQPQPSYSLHPKRDSSAFVAWQDKHAERDPAVAEYLRKYGVPKTMFPGQPQVFDSAQHESAGNVVPESLVSGAGA